MGRSLLLLKPLPSDAPLLLRLLLQSVQLDQVVAVGDLLCHQPLTTASWQMVRVEAGAAAPTSQRIVALSTPTPLLE